MKYLLLLLMTSVTLGNVDVCITVGERPSSQKLVNSSDETER